MRMERDNDFIREVLFKIAADPDLDHSRFKTFNPSDFPERNPSRAEIDYHLWQLIDSGFAAGRCMAEMPTVVSGLTWNGHEFLDNIRDKGIWEETKKRVSGLAGIGMSVIAAVAEAEVKKRLGLT